MAEYEGPLFETECLKIATFLRVHKFRVHGKLKLDHGRTLFIFQDPEGKADALALEFHDSETKDALIEREALISYAKSGSSSRRR